MSITAIELLSRAMTDAGFSRPSQTQISTQDSAPNKAYYALLKSINWLTEMTPDLGWNDDEKTASTVASTASVTLDSTTNANIIFWVGIDSAVTLLNRTTRETLVRETYPTVSSPTTTAKPQLWYVQSDALKLWPIPDAVYTITYGFQKLPQTFTADACTSTTLNIYDDIIQVLQGAVTIEILEQFGGIERAAYLANKITDMNNPYSLIRNAIRNNKLEEKKDRARFRYAGYFRRSRMI